MASFCDKKAGDLHSQPPPVTIDMWCSLEELYTGVTKKLKVTRTVPDEDKPGKTKIVEEILCIPIMPGWKQDTRINIKKKGNVLQQGELVSDLEIILQEKPHHTFTRYGRDLVMTKKISLLEALTGCRFEIGTLDGRTLVVQVWDIVHWGYEKVLMKEGMPLLAKDLERISTLRGNLRIKFEVEFPKKLNVLQKADLKKTLGGV